MQPPEPSPAATILLIEESPSLRENLADILRMADYQVAIAATPVEGQKLLQTGSQLPDLIMLGVYENTELHAILLETLRRQEQWRSIPLLLVSAEPQSVIESRLAGLKVVDYLMKPFDTKRLVAAVQQALVK